jgi:alpha-tubulin suppressor-like RCC1 family protein
MASYIRIRNNVILGETKKSLRVDNQTGGGVVPGLVVENNIIDGSTAEVSKITTMNNNLFLSKYSASGLTYIGPTDHYVAGEPRPFVDEVNGDYRIVATSWAVDNGVSWTFSGGDLAEDPIVGIRDVGAFEYQPPLQEVVLSGGYGHSVVLKADRSVWTWGLNDKGQLGNGGAIPGTNTKVPAQLSTISGVISVSGGYSHTIALKADGTVWCWGANNYGQLGNGTTSESSNPVQVSLLTDVVRVAAGAYHNLALKSDGTLWGWGRNSTNQIVAGGGNKTAPVQISIANVVKLAPGSSHSIVLKSDGTVWGWGYNTSGQLGIGNFTNQSIPVQVTGLSSIADVEAGASHSVAISTGGAVSTWGINTYGQLGDGTTTNRNTPYTIVTLTGCAKAACGQNDTKILTASGSVWGFGSNAQGQLGIGLIGGTYPSPVQITSLSGVVDIGTGDRHGLHRKADGTIATVGYNLNGQLGDNSNTTRSVPVTAVGVNLN